jgi:hypothetical protein
MGLAQWVLAAHPLPVQLHAELVHVKSGSHPLRLGSPGEAT